MIPQQTISANNNKSLKPFPQAVRSTQAISVSPGMNITDIIQKVSDYSTIIFEPGKYLETIRVTKPLYFQANGKVSLRSGGTNECLIISSHYASFTGFSIKQKSSKIRGAVKITSGAVVFQNCVFKTRSMPTIQIQNNSLIQIKNCKVYGSKGPALQASNQSQVEGVDTTFSNGATSIVSLTNEVVGHFTRCSFNEARNGGITVSESSLLFVNECTFNHSMVEFRTNASGCVIDNSTFGNDSLIRTNGTSNVTITRNTLTDSLIQADANSILILNSNKYNSGYLIAQGGSSVTLDNETFTGTVETSIRSIENAKCIIRNCSLLSITGHGIISYGSSSLSVENCQFSSISNSPIVCHSGCIVALANLTFQSIIPTSIVLNSVSQASLLRVRVENSNGNGCEINGCENSVKISECIFNSNKKCGIILSNIQNGVIIDGNSSFSGNSFSGIHCASTTVQISNSIFQQNQKGGIFASQSSKVIVAESTFAGNSWAAIHIDSQSQLQADSSVFQSNNISINVDGNAAVNHCKFVQSTQKSSIQVSGVCTIGGSEFSNDKCSILSLGQGQITIEKSVFQINETHIKLIDNGQCKCTECQFSQASGDSAIHVGKGSSIVLQNCMISQNNSVGIASDGKIAVYESTISNSGKVGLFCREGSTGEVARCEISNNGESGVLCTGGTPKIFENNITNNGKFGIYIADKVSPSVEANKFTSNHLAHIWRAE